MVSKKKPELESIVVNNLIVVSDLHVGCQVGLVRKCGAALDGGGKYMPNIVQQQMWAWWLEFWKWAERAVKGEEFGVVINGDVMDGIHHDSCTQWAQNLADQAEEAYQVLAPIVDRCNGKFYIIRGTEAHTGKSGQEEEKLASRLGAIPTKAGQYARNELWKWVGENKASLVHIQHHIGTTGSQAFESTALHKELVEAWTEAARWGIRPPDAIVRSHRHRNLTDKAPAKNGSAWVSVTPGWQGKTPFTFRIAGARQTQPQFGGLLVRHGDEELFIREWVRALPRPDPE